MAKITDKIKSVFGAKQKFAAHETPSTVPVFKSKRGFKHVPYTDSKNGGKEDAYPIELMNYKGSSSWHGAILQYIIDQVSGTGFEPLNDGEEFDEKTKKFLENINQNGLSANKLLEMLAYDEAVFNGISTVNTWDAKFQNVIKVDHVSFANVRCAPVNQYGEIDTYFYSWDWTERKYLRQEMPAFDFAGAKTIAEELTEATINDDAETLVRIQATKNSQLYRSIPYSPDNVYYPLPSYVGCLSSIRTDITSDIFGENILENGFSAGVHINMVGNFSDEEFLEECKVVEHNYTGSKEAGVPFITQSATKETAVVVTPIKTDSKEDRYSKVNEVSRQKIISGHRLTSPLLVGIALAGALGNREEFETAYNIFQKTVIQPKQNKIVSFLNPILKLNGMQEVKIGKLLLFDADEKETNEITE